MTPSKNGKIVNQLISEHRQHLNLRICFWHLAGLRFTVSLLSPLWPHQTMDAVRSLSANTNTNMNINTKTKKYTGKLVHPCHYCHQWLHLEPSRDRRPQVQLQHLYQTTITTTFPDLFHLQKSLDSATYQT